VRTDRAACGTALHVALRVSRALALLMAPFTPFSSFDPVERARVRLGRPRTALGGGPPGRPAGQKAPRRGAPVPEDRGRDPGEADRLDVRVGRVIEVQDHPNADKLYVIQVDIGSRCGPSSGMKANYTKGGDAREARSGPLQPRAGSLRSVLSNGMVLAAEDERDVGSHPPERRAPRRAGPRSPRGPRLPFSEIPEVQDPGRGGDAS